MAQISLKYISLWKILLQLLTSVYFVTRVSCFILSSITTIGLCVSDVSVSDTIMMMMIMMNKILVKQENSHSY